MTKFLDPLDSIMFMSKETALTFRKILRLEQIFLDRVIRQYRQDPQTAICALSFVRALQVFCQEIIAVANATLGFRTNDAAIVGRFAEKRLRRPPGIPRDQWLSVVAEVLGNLGWAAAQLAESTLFAWIAGAAINLYKRDYIGLPNNRQDVFHFGRSDRPEVISLSDPAFEFVEETPITAEVVNEYDDESVNVLISAMADDPEVMRYAERVIEDPKRKREALWKEMGLSPVEGRRIDRRYRNRRQRVRVSGLAKKRTTRAPRGISDASSTVYFEVFYDGTHGAATGTWQHRRLQLEE